MKDNGIMIVILYCGTPIILVTVLPSLIGCITGSIELRYLLIFTGMILTLFSIPVLNKIVDKYM